MAILAKDTFTDINDTFVNVHTPDIGVAWTGIAPFATISSNTLRSPNNFRSEIFQEIDDGGLDSYVQMKLTSVFNWTVGLYLRCQDITLSDSQSIFIEVLTNAGGLIRIWNKKPTLLADISRLLAPNETLKVSVSGGPIGATVTVYVDDIIIWQGTATVDGNGFAGLCAGHIGGYVYVDDFEYGTTYTPTPIIGGPFPCFRTSHVIGYS